VVDTLKQEGVWQNTLLSFLTDNGGVRAMDANNTPLRGFKAQNYEGGIRTPFIVSWPDRVKGGRRIDTPICSLDILPTALDAAGARPPTDKPFDGRSLLPLLAGQTQAHHQTLYWSEGGANGGWAVRSGDWKLVAQRGQTTGELFNLANDPAEKTDLASRSPEKVAELMKLYDAWLDQMAEPMSGTTKRWTGPAWSRSQEIQGEEKEIRSFRRAAEIVIH
jgi:arylsulfatase A-like enzyme